VEAYAELENASPAKQSTMNVYLSTELNRTWNCWCFILEFLLSLNFESFDQGIASWYVNFQGHDTVPKTLLRRSIRLMDECFGQTPNVFSTPSDLRMAFFIRLLKPG